MATADQPVPTSSGDAAALPPVHPNTKALFHGLCGIYNMVGDKDGEDAMFAFVTDWLKRHDIAFQQDRKWGVFARIPLGKGPKAPGVLLAGHLDSDLVEKGASISYDQAARQFRFDGLVGLDDKTGVISILLALGEILSPAGQKEFSALPKSFDLCVLFTVGEEVGQKGAIQFPLGQVLAAPKNVRYTICVDRRTAKHETAIRHVVNNYHGVPLEVAASSAPDDEKKEQAVDHSTSLLSLLNLAAAGAGLTPLEETASNACSDVLELRGRWDAEVVLPAVIATLDQDQEKDKDNAPLQVLRTALRTLNDEYKQAKQVVVSRMQQIPFTERVSSMYSAPRSTRYKLLQKIHSELYAPRRLLRNGKVQQGTLLHWCTPELALSAGNLSLDYTELSGQTNAMSADELERTGLLLTNLVRVWGGVDPASLLPCKVGKLCQPVDKA